MMLLDGEGMVVAMAGWANHVICAVLCRLIHMVHAQLILTNLTKMPVIHQKTDQLLTSIIQHLHVRRWAKWFDQLQCVLLHDDFF
jgi:hypothetical protein